MNVRGTILSLVIGWPFFVSASYAAELGRVGPVIARGEVRREIESTPILERPYRPLHFYGNTVRRAYYRGSSQGRPSDSGRATGSQAERR